MGLQALRDITVSFFPRNSKGNRYPKKKAITGPPDMVAEQMEKHGITDFGDEPEVELSETD